jgi:4-aminobutyrate aminotransferase-like enzyme
VPDVICLGKAIAGGFPISACVGKSPIMEKAWPMSQGEAIHTSTFLGHPVGCAMALAQIEEIRSLNLVAQAGEHGELLLQLLGQIRHPGVQLGARGIGLMAGIEISQADGAPATNTTMRITKAMLKRGYIMLPEGVHSNVLSFTPPLTVSQRQLRRAVKTLETVVQEVR